MFNSKSFLITVLFIILGLACFLTYNFFTWRPSLNTESPLHSLKIQRIIELPSHITDLSGLTFDPSDNTLYGINNKPTEIYHISLDGKLLKTIPLKGFGDTEGIEFLSSGFFAIIDEHLQQIVTIQLSQNTTEIHYKDGTVAYFDKSSFNSERVRNRGFEGITIDENGQLIIANEEFPVLIGDVQKNIQDNEFKLTNTLAPPTKDVAGLHYWSEKNLLLVLSEASKTLSAYNDNGELLGSYTLTYDRLGLFPRIQQPEGITMDAQHRIYIASEPNLIYVLE